MKTKQDQAFKKPKSGNEDFRFGKNVVQVFDDMVERSVPFYTEIQRMIAEIAKDFAKPGSTVYDLGCSTGNTLLGLDRELDSSVSFVGIDSSQQMVDKCTAKFKEAGVTRNFQVKLGDLNQGVILENASVVVMCLTLQFIRPLYREKILKEIQEQLDENSCFILVEKVVGEDSLLNRIFIKYYYDMKRRHNYSDLEISQKREALENVLIPYRLSENLEVLSRCGFRYSEVFFKWYNFAGIVSVK